jgi:hypothetical protein
LNGHGFARVLVVISLAIAGSPMHALARITYDDDASRRMFANYVATLKADPMVCARELATVGQLERSEVEYRISVGGMFRASVEGELTSDGERVFVRISNGGDSRSGNTLAFSHFSTRACIAHELEHARQFDDGEFAFARQPASTRWYAERPSFDISDEMRAWQAQLRVATTEDFWRRVEGSSIARPSLLAKFAAASSDAERMQVLRDNGYRKLYPIPNCQVTAPSMEIRPGQLVRPGSTGRLFGRVYQGERVHEVADVQQDSVRGVLGTSTDGRACILMRGSS